MHLLGKARLCQQRCPFVSRKGARWSYNFER